MYLAKNPCMQTVELPIGPVIELESISYIDAAGDDNDVDVDGVRVAGDQFPPRISSQRHMAGRR